MLPAKPNPRLMPAAVDGEFMQNVGRQVRGINMMVFNMIGGVQRYAEWADENPDKFYTGPFAKLITKEVEHSATEGVEQLLERLEEAESAGVLDADFEEVEEDD